jgi:Ca2+-binding EF-hand superfamily protein
MNGATPPARETLATVRSSGEDKADGNDLVAGDNRSDQETGTHPVFKSLDTKNNGYLTADDLKSHKWLSKNFAKCDSDHDGHLSQKEYASCTK